MHIKVPIRTLSSGVPGLDEVLGGGIVVVDSFRAAVRTCANTRSPRRAGCVWASRSPGMMAS
jgi:hypothetical protein